ncbi:MAG: glycosyltransferase family 2 protein [Candidatus Omnitrophota bacterium]
MVDIIYKSKITKRTFQDKLISGFNSVRYAVTEPLMLKVVRLKYEHQYNNPNENSLVSVYIPTYNRGEILMERAVPSVLGQTYKNLELIIIGDHCTDDTEHRISKIKDPRVRFYNIPQRVCRYPETAENHWLAGPVVAANTGLSMIKGKWIARIDDDDTWISDHIEVLLRFAQHGNYEFVSAQYVEERHGVKRVDTGVKALDPYYTRKNGLVPNDCPRLGGTQTWLYRSYLKFIKYNINCWRKSWNRVNDIDLSQRIYHADVRMGFLDKVVAYMIPRPGETTVGLEAYQLQEKEKINHFRFTV